MEYYVHILSVGDADAIVINYQDDNTRWWTIVIDAGNVGVTMNLSIIRCLYHFNL